MNKILPFLRSESNGGINLFPNSERFSRDFSHMLQEFRNTEQVIVIGLFSFKFVG